MIRRLVVLAGLALAVACASAPKTDAADPREKDPKFRYGRNPGLSAVGSIPDIVLTDSSRNAKAVKLTIDYPTATGPHPLIVFSHGNGLSNRSYPGLAAHWATYGYVVIRPAHHDVEKVEDMTPNDWRDRARDISFILDSLGTLETQYPELKGKIDANRIAVAGHSRGAVTAMMLGGLRIFPGPVSVADPRVKAIAALSPAGPKQEWGLTSESYADIRVPALFMTGSRDTGATEDQTPEWRAQAYELAPAGDKWLVSIEGLQHGTFTGLAQAPQAIAAPSVRMNPNADPMDARRQVEREAMDRARRSGMDSRAIFDTLRALALAFFDTYLKDDAQGRQYLEQADARDNIEVKRK